jgi:hypothetical protein
VADLIARCCSSTSETRPSAAEVAQFMAKQIDDFAQSGEFTGCNALRHVPNFQVTAPNDLKDSCFSFQACEAKPASDRSYELPSDVYLSAVRSSSAVGPGVTSCSTDVNADSKVSCDKGREPSEQGASGIRSRKRVAKDTLMGLQGLYSHMWNGL